MTLFVALGMQAQRHVMTVDVSKPTARINPAMYGVFFDDINFGADGCLYAELVKHRSFEFPQRFMGWNIFGNVTAVAVCRLFHISDPIAKGVSIGSAAHALGTAKAIELGEVEGAMSGLSIVVAGLLTVAGASVFANFM